MRYVFFNFDDTVCRYREFNKVYSICQGLTIYLTENACDG